MKSSSKKNPCKVCSNITGKCKVSQDSLKGVTYLCMTRQDRDEIPGLSYRGTSKDGSWGIWVPEGNAESNGNGSSGGNRNGNLRSEKPRTKKSTMNTTIAEALTDVSGNGGDEDTYYGYTAQLRHMSYTAALAELAKIGLHPDDAADCDRRGITPELLAHWGAQSVEAWQPLSGSYSEDAPGIVPSLGGGWQINNPDAGLLCPIKDVDGCIVGFQIRGRDAGRNRYRFLVGKNARSQKNTSLRLPDTHEIPLAIHRPMGNPSSAFVGVCEGVGAKPLLLAQRLEMVVIGNVLGLSDSPKTLAATLDKLTQELGSKPVIRLFPDAGGRSNLIVERRDQRSIAALQGLGYRVEVAYWGQGWDKEAGDCDEVKPSTLEAANMLKPDDYFGMALSPIEQARVEIRQVVRSKLTPLALISRKAEIYTLSRLPEKMFGELWDAVVREEDNRDSAASIQDMLNAQAGATARGLNPLAFFPPKLAEQVKEGGHRLGTTSEAVVVTHLAAAGAFIKRKTNLTAFGMRGGANIFSLVCAESGVGKTPTQNMVMGSLFRRQESYDERYQQELAAWESIPKEHRTGPKPVPRELFVTDATMEGLSKIGKQQPNNSLVYYCDEILAFFKSQDAYRNGRGSDQQKMLSARDGGMQKIARTDDDKRISANFGFSLTGSIQRDVFLDLLAKTDNGDGTWPRFYLATIPKLAREFEDDSPASSVVSLFESAYRTIDSWDAQDFVVAPEAKPALKQWLQWLDAKRMSDPRPNFASFWSKAQKDTLTIALITHMFLWAAEGHTSPPPKEVGISSLKAAEALIRYNVAQWEALEAETVSSYRDDLINAIVNMSAAYGEISARDIKRSISIIKRDKNFNAEQIRDLMIEAEAQGRAITIGTGKSMRIRATQQPSAAAVALPIDPGEWDDSIFDLSPPSPALPATAQQQPISSPIPDVEPAPAPSTSPTTPPPATTPPGWIEPEESLLGMSAQEWAEEIIHLYQAKFETTGPIDDMAQVKEFLASHLDALPPIGLHQIAGAICNHSEFSWAASLMLEISRDVAQALDKAKKEKAEQELVTH